MLASSPGPCAGANLAGRRKSSAPRRRGVRRSDAPGDPERYLRGKAPHPSVCACGASTSPCRGGFMPHRLPCKGSWRRSRLRGALPLCAGSVLQNPAEPAPSVVGDDACIVPWTLRRRKPCGQTKIIGPPGAGACGGLTPRRPGKIFAGQGAAPLRLRLRRIHLPLQGRLYGAAAAPKAPLQGELSAKPTEGCIAALRRECPAKSGRALIRAA